MRKKIVLEDDLKDDIYNEFPLSKFTMFFFTIILIITGFCLNFPFEERLANLITSQLKKNKSCPIMFDRLKIKVLNPHIIIKNLLIAGRCFNNQQGSLTLDSINVKMSLPSASPPGLKLKVEINKGRSFIKLFPTISVANQKIEIHPSSRISFEDFREALENKISLKGNMKLSGNVLLKGQSVQSAVFNLSSRNLSIPPQTVNNFNLPLISLGKLTFKAKIDRRGLLKIESFQAGSKESPVLATISGSMNINKRFINRSTLNLIGKIKFSSQFYQKDFPILNLLLSGKQKDPQGFFSFTIKGSAMAPQFKIR